MASGKIIAYNILTLLRGNVIIPVVDGGQGWRSLMVGRNLLIINTMGEIAYPSKRTFSRRITEDLLSGSGNISGDPAFQTI